MLFDFMRKARRSAIIHPNIQRFFRFAVLFIAGIACALVLVLFCPALTDAIVDFRTEILEKADETLLSDEPDLPQTGALLAAAYEAAACFPEHDYRELAKLVHPEKGVVFVPYTTVDLSTNCAFTAAQIRALGSDSTKRIWGATVGTNQPIEMTADAYIDRYVYDADYLNTAVVAANKPLGNGSMSDNSSSVFPGSRYVEFYVGSGDGGTGWTTLRLVFEKYEDAYMLIAVIHGEWTS